MGKIEELAADKGWRAYVQGMSDAFGIRIGDIADSYLDMINEIRADPGGLAKRLAEHLRSGAWDAFVERVDELAQREEISWEEAYWKLLLQDAGRKLDGED